VRPRLGLATVMAALFPAAALAGSDSDMLAKFGLIGSWALDCHAPPSMGNPFQTFVPSNAGDPLRQLIVGDPNRDRTVPVHDVALLPHDQLQLSFAQNTVTVTVVLAKDKGHIRPVESITSDGQTIVKDGIVQRSGQRTLWLEKCPG